ncbi:MAG: glycosyltransferase [Ruminococcus sp.]|nr:glycosyltransferase [Ruminococcus sp.]
MNILSIGIIVKNEEKNLAKCLDSIEELRKKLDCKVIIADTGSTDDTAKLAEKRADIFMKTTWNTDFSDARNALLKKIDSEWFMYIDADEVLPENNNLAEFFTSGDYKNYNCASLDIKTVFNDRFEQFGNTVRLVKFTPETKFEGIINETFTGDLSICKNLRITLEHSGYTDEFVRAKEIRNSAMSRLAIADEKNPVALVRDYMSLADSLYKYDVDEAEKAWEQALSVDADFYSKCCLIVRKMDYYFDSNEYNKALEEHEKYKKFRESENTRLLYTDIEDAYLSGASAARSDKFDFAAEMLTKFEEYYKYYNENYDDFVADRRFYPAVNTSEYAVKLAYGMLTASCMKSKRYDTALSRLMESPTASTDIIFCMDNQGDLSRLPEYLAVPGAADAAMKYIYEAVHPIELSGALAKVIGQKSDFAVIHRYLTEPFDCDEESLHAKKVIIEYLTKTKTELEDLEYLVNDYISHVYVTSDSIHYSDVITSAQHLFAENSTNTDDV